MAKEDKKSSDSKLSPGVLGGLVALGAANALWAVFLWGELLVTRAGGSAFCAVSEHVDCTALWDGRLASGIHAATKIPVAGWGVVWSLAATCLPLYALVQLKEDRKADSFVAGTVLLAASGALTVIALVMYSVVEHTLCLGCFGTYGLVAAYSALAYLGLRSLSFDIKGGAMPAAVALFAASLLMLYPGMKTPSSSESSGMDAIKNSAPVHETAPTTTPSPHGASSSGTGNAQLDQQIDGFIKSLPGPALQTLADSLAKHKHSKAGSLPGARAIIGSADANVRIDEWTDARCGHCAQLHATLKEIMTVVPQGSFSVVPHHFPLDGACNPSVQRKAEDPVSCVAAAAQICLEGDQRLFEFTELLFNNQNDLTSAQVYELAGPFMDKAALKTCVESAETKKKLDEDIALGVANGLEGTPLVLVNGRAGTAFGPFVYLMILTGGDANHPAFAQLPPGNAQAHIH